MSPDDWYELAVKESNECGFVVSEGYLYCRVCGGGGYDYEEGQGCAWCHGQGELVHDDYEVTP